MCDHRVSAISAARWHVSNVTAVRHVVGSLREVTVKNDLRALHPGVAEHTLHPIGEELAVRLESGPVGIFMHEVSPGLRPGSECR
jgi:hypothetical protein